MNKGHLELTLAVVPLAASGLYLLGFIYHIGYLNAFGIEDSLFPLASDRILLVGYIAIMDLGLVPITYIFFAVCILLLAVLIAAFISTTTRAKKLFNFLHIINNKLKRTVNISKPSPEMDMAVDKTSYLVIFTGGIFIILFLLAIITLFASKSGEAEALRQMENYKSNETNWLTIHSKSPYNKQRAMQIICSDKHCAFWTGENSIVLKHDDITQLVMHKPKKEEDSNESDNTTKTKEK